MVLSSSTEDFLFVSARDAEPLAEQNYLNIC